MGSNIIDKYGRRTWGGVYSESKKSKTGKTITTVTKYGERNPKTGTTKVTEFDKSGRRQTQSTTTRRGTSYLQLDRGAGARKGGKKKAF
jgi:hypothetical protein